MSSREIDEIQAEISDADISQHISVWRSALKKLPKIKGRQHHTFILAARAFLDSKWPQELARAGWSDASIWGCGELDCAQDMVGLQGLVPLIAWLRPFDARICSVKQNEVHIRSGPGIGVILIMRKRRNDPPGRKPYWAWFEQGEVR